MNREEHLQNEFPNKDGKTYIQSLDESNSIKSRYQKILDEVKSPEYKEKCIKKNEEYLQKISMDYQLGFYIGEYIVDRYLPTLSTDMLQTKQVIQVSDEDTIENNRLNQQWYETTKYQKNWSGDEDGDKDKWNLYYQHNKMLIKKYLPLVLGCAIRIIRIDDMKSFKDGLINSLWNCDMCSYNLDEQNIEIENELEYGFTHFKFKLDIE